MITDGNKWHYLARITLSAVLAKKSSNHNGDFYCLNSFNWYNTKNKLKYNPGEKSLKAPFAIYLDLKCLLKKEQSRQNNLEISYTEKKARQGLSGWAMLIKCSFDEEENKCDYYREKNCIDKFCKELKKRVMEIINYEKKRNDATNCWRKYFLWWARSMLHM